MGSFIFILIVLALALATPATAQFAGDGPEGPDGPFHPPPQPTSFTMPPAASPIPVSNALGRTPPYLTNIQLQAAKTPSVVGIPINGFATFQAKATTTCLGSGKLTNGSYGVALNAHGTGMITDSADPKFCGKCVRIMGPKGNITAKVVDACYGPSCDFVSPLHLEVVEMTNGTSTFSKIANGKISPVSWQYTAC
ncbi:hypothetical protein SeMB42_g01540 [Synchytrium endobioticum]|uniref:Expansin-like EG45 domain-containing protein n=1 Tax=Synchytrium endobioticum TaxID=286115 RepID=A0A507D092_9FUNG|nr:hypothetical protein SeLEV6574_g04405 [Synchytrium endobioticum]TPX52283.1 hypothetical protein SeMB42_g01540 [Synchytrium endobioticum]